MYPRPETRLMIRTYQWFSLRPYCSKLLFLTTHCRLWSIWLITWVGALDWLQLSSNGWVDWWVQPRFRIWVLLATQLLCNMFPRRDQLEVPEGHQPCEKFPDGVRQTLSDDEISMSFWLATGFPIDLCDSMIWGPPAGEICLWHCRFGKGNCTLAELLFDWPIAWLNFYLTEESTSTWQFCWWPSWEVRWPFLRLSDPNVWGHKKITLNHLV